MDDIISDYPQTALRWWPIVKGTDPLITEVGRLAGISGSIVVVLADRIKDKLPPEHDRYSGQIIALLIFAGFWGIILLDKIVKLCLKDRGDLQPSLPPQKQRSPYALP